jgi:hypothetical protein
MSAPCPNMSHLKKYRDRPSPAYPANLPGCRNKRKLGNDKTLWQSTCNASGTYTWRRVAGNVSKSSNISANVKPKRKIARSPFIPAEEASDVKFRNKRRRGQDGKWWRSSQFEDDKKWYWERSFTKKEQQRLEGSSLFRMAFSQKWP